MAPKCFSHVKFQYLTICTSRRIEPGALSKFAIMHETDDRSFRLSDKEPLDSYDLLQELRIRINIPRNLWVLPIALANCRKIRTLGISDRNRRYVTVSVRLVQGKVVWPSIVPLFQMFFGLHWPIGFIPGTCESELQPCRVRKERSSPRSALRYRGLGRCFREEPLTRLK